MYELQVTKKLTFQKKTMTIREFMAEWVQDIDCQPVGQRLETSTNPKKREGIMGAIIDGINIGEITICLSPNNPDGYKYESIDGGHRKRYSRDYVQGVGPNRFQVRGKYFSELSQEEKNEILDYQITLVIYDELDTFTKGYIFRTLNETTDVNDQETRNSFGDINVANVIRESVRNVQGVGNSFHQLFEKTQGGNPRWLMFDNHRLRSEEFVARIVYRLTQETYLGESSQEQLDQMYIDNDKLDIVKIKKELKEVLDFLMLMATEHNRIYNRGLSQQDFKMLYFVWLYMKDTFKKWRIQDSDTFIRAYKEAFLKLSDNNGEYGKIMNPVDFDNKARAISEAFTSYLGAPNHQKKVKQTVIWLLSEFNLEDYILVLDSKRVYTQLEKERKLIEQNYKCYITGQKVTMKDCEAAHIVSHTDGGKSTYDNFVMVLKEHNRKMGSMNLNDYMDTLK